MATDLFVESFRNYLMLELSYSEYTVVNYCSDLDKFKKFFHTEEEKLEWEDVDADVVRRWIVHLMDMGFSPASVNRKLSSLRTFYKFLLRKQVVKVNPVDGIRGPKRKKTLPCFVREEDMDRLLDETDFGDGFEACRDKMVIEMFYNTGMRLSELIGLNDGDVDFVAMRVKILGKGNKQRYVPFGENLKDALLVYLENRNSNCERLTEAFFVNSKGRRISRTTVKQLVKKSLSKVVRLKKRSPHVLRHSFATSMLNNNAELGVVKELLGHESLAATEIYTHMTFEELKKVYKLAHPRA